MSDLRPNSEIADGIHWLKDRFVNNYIIENSGELVLIDAAFNKKAKGIMNYIKTELEDKKIAKIYLTHHHMDHRGGLHYLHEEFHPRIFVSDEDSRIVTGEEKSPLPNNIFLKPIFFILRPFLSPKTVEAVELIEDGQEMDGMSVYHLPGHTMGSMGFLKNQVMFSGDAAVTDNGDIVPGRNMFAESVSIAEQSYQKMTSIDFSMILPGHGDPILEDANLRLTETIEKLDL